MSLDHILMIPGVDVYVVPPDGDPIDPPVATTYRLIDDSGNTLIDDSSNSLIHDGAP